MQYKPVHSYVLQPVVTEPASTPEMQKSQLITKSKMDRLRELKQLLDEKIITTEEFEKEKAKILDAKE